MGEPIAPNRLLGLAPVRSGIDLVRVQSAKFDPLDWLLSVRIIPAPKSRK